MQNISLFWREVIFLNIRCLIYKNAKIQRYKTSLFAKTQGHKWQVLAKIQRIILKETKRAYSSSEIVKNMFVFVLIA
ncbi:MAG: hypothetical protein EGR93_10140 [Prevotella sp.]|nr:hypothetical protein [Prevotella sp.]